jgi:hypothetical protein
MVHHISVKRRIDNFLESNIGKSTSVAQFRRMTGAKNIAARVFELRREDHRQIKTITRANGTQAYVRPGTPSRTKAASQRSR